MLKKIGSVPRALAIALLVAGLPAGVARALEPIYNVVDHPLPASAQRLSMEEIRRVIMAAGAQRQWLFEVAGPDALLASQDARGYTAKVKVTYSQKAYSISLVATNLEQSGNEIHRKYNQWVRNLEKDIEVRLAVDALRSN